VPPDAEEAGMSASVHEVIGRPEMGGWANLDDFALGPGSAADAGSVLQGQDWSLYGLDEARDVAVFTELPPGTDLAGSPFAYLTQHRLARRVAVMPLAEFEAVAEGLPLPGRTVLVFSTGRCGSTLLSHALNAVPGVWCLSEPDAYSTLVMQHYHSLKRAGFPRDRVVRLIRAITKVQCRPPAGRRADVFAVKFRNQSLYQADLYQKALPDSSHIFLYRDALGWANSVYGMLRQYGYPDIASGAGRTAAWSIFTGAKDLSGLAAIIGADAPETPLELPLAPVWADMMAEYARQLEGGVPFLALRYNEFNRDRVASVRRILRHCGLPEVHAEQALAAFETDSQAGTHVAREVTTERLSGERLARLRDILARCGAFGDPDMRLADMYSAAQA
jgi:LPS sulfotransferase NodH